MDSQGFKEKKEQQKSQDSCAVMTLVSLVVPD
jgi:hypothetical protein